MSIAPEPWVIGLDPSLRRTGIAYADGTVAVIKTDKLRGMERLAVVLDAVRLALDCYGCDPDLVLIEGYSFASANAAHQMGEIGGVVRMELHRQHLRWLSVSPGTLKKYATGNGQSKKTAMVVAARDRLGYQEDKDDEADALWLRAAGHELLGAPLASLPKLNRSALDVVRLHLDFDLDPDAGGARPVEDVPTGERL